MFILCFSIPLLNTSILLISILIIMWLSSPRQIYGFFATNLYQISKIASMISGILGTYFSVILIILSFEFILPYSFKSFQILFYILLFLLLLNLEACHAQIGFVLPILLSQFHWQNLLKIVLHASYFFHLSF